MLKWIDDCLLLIGMNLPDVMSFVKALFQHPLAAFGVTTEDASEHVGLRVLSLSLSLSRMSSLIWTWRLTALTCADLASYNEHCRLDHPIV